MVASTEINHMASSEARGGRSPSKSIVMSTTTIWVVLKARRRVNADPSTHFVTRMS